MLLSSPRAIWRSPTRPCPLHSAPALLSTGSISPEKLVPPGSLTGRGQFLVLVPPRPPRGRPALPAPTSQKLGTPVPPPPTQLSPQGSDFSKMQT